MKHFILPCLVSVFMLIACNSNKTKDSKTTEETSKENSTTESSSDNKTQTTADEALKKMDELRKLPSLTNDQLKALLPEELAGLKRSSFTVNSAMGYGIGQAEYSSDDGKEMRLVIYDCVGEAGVGWYSMMFWGWNMERQDANGYEKTTTFNGGKAIEKYEKGQDKYSLTFPASNRLLVNLEGEKTGLDAVKQAASSLNLKVN